MSKKKEKLRAQVKSRFYYVFWGAATLSVFAGQLYVGTGYRRMSESVNKVLEAPIIIEPIKPPLFHRNPMIIPEYDTLYHPTDPPIEI